MKNSQQVWTLNTTVWKWELESYFTNKMADDGFVEDLIILAVIVGVILVLIFILAIQISRSYFKTTTSATTVATSKSSNPLDEKVAEYSDVVLEMDLNKTDPPSYFQVCR